MKSLPFEEFLSQKIHEIDMPCDLKSFFLSPRQAVVFGCGNQGYVSTDLCHMFHKKVFSFLVSDGGQRLYPFWPEIPFFTLSQFPVEMKKDVDIIISVSEKYNNEIRDVLLKGGFENVFCVENWTDINEKICVAWHDIYFSYQMTINPESISFVKDINDETFLRVSLGSRFFAMYYSDEPCIRRNVLGNFRDVALPSLFGQNDYVTEGPYEYGNVSLKEGDIVLDLGSNLGLFSSVALAKGCCVHAFEPTPSLTPLLEKTLSLSGKKSEYTIWPYAVSDQEGESSFGMFDGEDGDLRLSRNSLFEKEGMNRSIVVKTISLDKFVADNKIQKIDFIKADIEGAERYMLMGAKQVLRDFAPKLALCTYHLPDDPCVMENLILEANPHYIIEHKWSKLYAYCPER